jgi:hypothetical protein
MVVLHFNVWLAARVGPIFFGMPVLFWYHALFAVASVGVLWLVFHALWPEEAQEERRLFGPAALSTRRGSVREGKEEVGQE